MIFILSVINRCPQRIHRHLSIQTSHLLLYQLQLLISLVQDCFERSVNNLKLSFFCSTSAYSLLSRWSLVELPVDTYTSGTSRRLHSETKSQLSVIGARELHLTKVTAVVLWSSATIFVRDPCPLSTDPARNL